MFRSLLTLLLLASLNTAPAADMPATGPFETDDLLTIESIPQKNSEAVAPVVNARAALLMDLDSGILLYEKNARQTMPMASLTKIMTALIILENHDLDEVVTIEDNFNEMEELGVRIWLNQYEKITVNNLLTGLLVRSAGDAAIALATYHSGSVDAFVNEMNARAQALHLNQTHFTNPIGIDNPGHYSSAFDLAILTKQALRHPDFRRIVRIPRATITSTDGEIVHEFESTNYLLESYLDIRGVKTGTTDEAGQSLINLAHHWSGKEVIVVLLDSPERFQESKRLIDWAFRNFSW
ncbi:D-alanyl-D-alanine carboxypeptidase [Candidatus Peregrinibacteria bacterium]|nr:D-alanyl-D-alanine carboxypeptidase [Candidatus Peregrinibacteria bacterium]